MPSFKIFNENKHLFKTLEEVRLVQFDDEDVEIESDDEIELPLDNSPLNLDFLTQKGAGRAYSNGVAFIVSESNSVTVCDDRGDIRIYSPNTVGGAGAPRSGDIGTTYTERLFIPCGREGEPFLSDPIRRDITRPQLLSYLNVLAVGHDLVERLDGAELAAASSDRRPSDVLGAKYVRPVVRTQATK